MSKYYLRVNEKNVIKLDDYPKYGDMTDLLSLCLFTSDFNNIHEIGEELKRLYLLKKNVTVEKIEIVSFYNGKYYLYFYEPLFKSEYQYFDEKTVVDFFRKNRLYYEEMSRIISRSKKLLEEILVKTEFNEKRAKYLESIRRKFNNISRLEVILVNLKNGHINFSQEYDMRLKEYVESEIFYKNGAKITINYKGLFEMAKTLNLALNYFPNLKKPVVNKQPKSISIVPKKLTNEELTDPDEYMFLEDDDFLGLYEGKHDDAVEDQIANLEEKKKGL